MTQQEHDWIISYLETITIGRLSKLERLAVISSMRMFMRDLIDYDLDEDNYIVRLEEENKDLKSKLENKDSYIDIIKGLVSKELIDALNKVVKEEVKEEENDKISNRID